MFKAYKVIQFRLQNMTNPLKIVMCAPYTYTCIFINVVECHPAHPNATNNPPPTPSLPPPQFQRAPL